MSAPITISSDDDDDSFLEFLRAPIPKLPPLKKPSRKKSAAKAAPKKTTKRKATTKTSLATIKRTKANDIDTRSSTPPLFRGLSFTRDAVDEFPMVPKFLQNSIKQTDIFEIFNKYKPQSTTELVTSRIRNNFVLKWVADNKPLARRCKVLLLHGPCGTGKQTLVESALREHNIKMRLWEPNENFSVEGEPITQIDTFKRALLHERYESNNVVGDTNHEKQFLVIKNLPSTNTDQSIRLRKQILDEFITSITKFGTLPFQSPVIFIYTSCNTHSVKYQLHKEFTDSFMQIVERYEVLPATEAQMKKRLTFIANKEIDDKSRTTKVIEEVLGAVKGDIRQGIHELAIRLKKGIPRQKSIQEIPQSQLPKECSYSTQLDSADDLQNNQILDVFHGAARILSSKRDIYSKKLEHAATETLKNVPADADKLIDYVHHSLPRYNQVGPHSIDRLTTVGRRMSEANVYGNMLGRWETGTWSTCMFRWSVDAHMCHQCPPARATGAESCHPPPFFRPFENQQVLSTVLSPVVGFGKPLPPTRPEICQDIGPMLDQILFRKKEYPHARRPLHPKFQLTIKQLNAIHEGSNYSTGIWAPKAAENVRLPICDRWQVCFFYNFLNSFRKKFDSYLTTVGIELYNQKKKIIIIKQKPSRSRVGADDLLTPATLTNDVQQEVVIEGKEDPLDPIKDF